MPRSFWLHRDFWRRKTLFQTRHEGFGKLAENMHCHWLLFVWGGEAASVIREREGKET
jgi:hypothetical protein